MGVAYYLLDIKGKKHYVGAGALGQCYKRCECWHSDENNLKMIHFMNKKYGGVWKLVSEDDDEALQAEKMLTTNLGFRKDVRTYASEIGLTSWNEVRMADLSDRESYLYNKKNGVLISYTKRYVKPIGKEEEEGLVMKYTACPTFEKMKMKLRQEFCCISIFNAMNELKDCTDKKYFIVRLVKRINEILVPKRKNIKKKRKVIETVIKTQKRSKKVKIEME